MTELERYYNSFNEDHRLTTRHGRVEYNTTMYFIHQHIPDKKTVNILDVGAGTGRYAVPLSQEGHSVTAVELVQKNLAVLEKKHSAVNCWPGDARDLSFLPQHQFDITLLLGPLYHVHGEDEMLLVFNEAKRVTKPGGIIFAGYLMNEYSVITYCFKQNHIKDVLKSGRLTKSFKTIPSKDDLYTYVRLEDIDALNAKAHLERITIFAPDGAADYMRRELNAMDEETFSLFMEFQCAVCQRKDLLGASSHLVDVLINPA